MRNTKSCIRYIGTRELKKPKSLVTQSEHHAGTPLACRQGAVGSVSMDRRVQKVMALIQAELHRSAPLHEVAESVNLSDSRLRHLFKIETGSSPSKFLKALRMQRAKQLCEATFLSIKEIKGRVGIRD